MQRILYEGEDASEFEHDQEYGPGDIKTFPCPTCGTIMKNDDGLFWCETCQAMYSEDDILDLANGRF